MIKRLLLVLLVLAVAAGALAPAATAGRPKPRADLVVAAVSSAPRVQQGAPLRVTAVVRNLGRRPAATSSVRFALSTDRRVGNDRTLGPTKRAPRLKPRRTAKVAATVVVPTAVRPGRYWLVACADAGRAVRERDERNNCRVAPRPVVVITRPRPVPPTTPQPPQPPVVPPSSHDLIEADVAAGRISADQGLVYRVFADFGDTRLPSRYAGKPNGLDEGGLAEAAQRWAELSPAHQEVLTPFLIPPFYAGSHWSPEPTAAPRARDTSGRRAFDAPWCAKIDGLTPTLETWDHLDTQGGDVRVWWLAANPGDAATAAHFVEILDGQVLPELGALMGSGLLPDGNGPCSGGSDALDIALVDATTATTFGNSYLSCSKVSSSMVFPRTAAGAGWKGADPYLAHEVMHALQLARPSTGSCRDTSWVREMTAQWVQDYVTDPLYGIGLGPDDTEHQAAPAFLDHPAVPLDVEAPPAKHDYGAYLLPQWMARRGAISFVRRVWDEMAEKMPVEAIDAALPNGFAGDWDDFVLSTWNRGAVPHFRDWDGLQAWAAITAEASVPAAGAAVQQFVPVPHLAAQFLDVKVGPTIKELEVTHDKAGDQRAKLRAVLTYDDGTTSVVDLSGRATSTLCIDDGTRRAVSVVLVYSNADLTKQTKVTTTLVGSTACGCQLPVRRAATALAASPGSGGGVCVLEGNLAYTFRDDYDGDDGQGRPAWLGREDESGTLNLVLVDDGAGGYTNGPGSTFSASGTLHETWWRHNGPDGCGDTTTDRTLTASGEMLPERAFAWIDSTTGDLLLGAGSSHPGRARAHVEAKCVQTVDREYDLLASTPPCTTEGLTPFYRLKPVAKGSKTYTISCSYAWTTYGPDNQVHRKQSTVNGTITLP